MLIFSGIVVLIGLNGKFNAVSPGLSLDLRDFSPLASASLCNLHDLLIDAVNFMC